MVAGEDRQKPCLSIGAHGAFEHIANNGARVVLRVCGLAGRVRDFDERDLHLAAIQTGQAMRSPDSRPGASSCVSILSGAEWRTSDAGDFEQWFRVGGDPCQITVRFVYSNDDV